MQTKQILIIHVKLVYKLEWNIKDIQKTETSSTQTFSELNTSYFKWKFLKCSLRLVKNQQTKKKKKPNVYMEMFLWWNIYMYKLDFKAMLHNFNLLYMFQYVLQLLM